MSGRRFRMKMRPGRAVVGATNDGTQPPSAQAGEELVVEEEAAAFLVRQRAAEIVEVIEAPAAEPTTHPARLEKAE